MKMADKRRKKRRKRTVRSRRIQIAAELICAGIVLVCVIAGIAHRNRIKKAASTEHSGTGVSVLVGNATAPELPEPDSAPEDTAGTALAPSPDPPEITPGPWKTPLDRYYLDKDFWTGCPPRNVQLLTPNEFSRPQTDIDEVNDIVVHYVDEPMSTAMQNRDYFESLKDGSRSASSHFIIDMSGEIVQCIPLGEVAYCSNQRNHDSISIECCHPDDTGEFTKETYNSCVDLCAWLCYAFEIGPEHVIRHYDVTEKYCPIFYVVHPDAWEAMKAKIAERYAEYEKQYGKRRPD